MKLSTRSKYGLLAMYELAKDQSSPLTIRAIAERQDLSEPYLEQLFAAMKKAGLLLSKRGAQGGYILAKPAAQISIGEIINALEGSTSITNCMESCECGDSCQCPSRPVYFAMQKSLDETMERMSLQDMLDGNLN